MWLNAFQCVKPTDEFAAKVGHEVIRQLVESNPDEKDLVWRRVTLEVVAS